VNHSWHSCSSLQVQGMYIPIPEVEKVIDSILFGKRPSSRLEELLKLIALKRYSWGHSVVYNIISELIEFFTLAHKSELSQGINGISYDDVAKQDINYYEIIEFFFW